MVAESIALRIIASSIEDVAAGDAVGMVVVMAAGRRLLKVVLPSFVSLSSLLSSLLSLLSSLSCHRGRIRGGEHHGITPGEDKDDESSSSFAIKARGVGLFLVHDFLGIAGHKQCLVLPLIAVPDDDG
jgi:hypothetical protein